jgi:CBS domain-containing protein
MKDVSPKDQDTSDEGGRADSLVSLFHRVNGLIPDEQAVICVAPNAPVVRALELMEEHGFSQLPVMEGDAVIGVFSYRSLARRVAQLGQTDVQKLEVDDCVEELRFVRVTDEIEELFDYLDRDGAVLVGDPDRLLAVATPTDLVRYLYTVTHPFVLIQEIEMVLRGLVSVAARPPELILCIERAITDKYRGRLDRLPRKLTDLDLGELVQTVIHGDNYSGTFSSVLGRNRDSTRGYLDPIPPLRNDVFHFRRRITGDDHRTLANTRTWLLRKARAAEARGSERDG